MVMTQCFEGISTFRFDYGSLNLDVIALEAETGILWIDTGLAEHAEALKAWQMKQGYTHSELVISHLHKDHFAGITVLQPDVIYGPNPTTHDLPEELLPFKHAYKVWDNTLLQFGEHTLTHQVVGGHSPCSQLIDIDQKMCHVGDLILYSAAERFSLPLITGKPEDYVMALEGIIRSKMDGFLAHGGFMPYRKLVYGAERTLDYILELSQPTCPSDVTQLKSYKHYPYSNPKFHAFNWRMHRSGNHV